MSEKPGFDFVIKNTSADEVIKYLEVAKQLMNGETGRYNLTIVVNEVGENAHERRRTTKA